MKDGPKNLDEICEALKVTKSGNISKYLHELESTGFIEEDVSWNIKLNKESNLKMFRLKDNYIRFYLKFILPNKAKIERLGFASEAITTLPSWESIMGLQFENLVVSNLPKLCEILHLNFQEIEKAGPFLQTKSTKQKGCQIDLLIQTKFGTLYLCEIKFSISEIGTKVIQEVNDKIRALSYPKGYSIRPILIHVNGVTQSVKESGVFDKIIDFAEFMKK